MKKTILSLALMMALLANVKAWALRFAYVDIAEVFDQYEGTKSAKEELKSDAEKKRKELEPEQDKLRQEVEDLQAKKSVLSQSKYQAEESKLREKAQQLQTKVQEIQDELGSREKKKTKAIVDEIRGLIKELAEEEKYDFVFEKSTLLYGGDDITYKVIKKLNNK